ncbi:alanine racemase [Endozoicomonas montiporae]|uniref:Alanine racemase n=2 Tax=Endozoicomonas montiporae TaxID=1027273 RepID=A0A081N1N4_9GAMM|nr:alanine racemase [Endozoicomonas montiporae]AMO58709.1 alanine racemase [Endozoicomonas montiporae CL-33]KEQ12357.1 alanine racemase [Endozoicomonas montiporae]
MSRPAKAVINLDALQHNYQLAKSLANQERRNGKVLAVVKADAYGHGAVACAQALADQADGFAVACIEEALELRSIGIRQSILLLEGFFEASELVEISRHKLDIVVQSPEQLLMLEQNPLPAPVRIWLKMDSGMYRVGLLPEEFRSAWLRMETLPWVSDIVMMTHLACADEPENGYTRHQLEVFEQHTLGLPGERSIANSAGLVDYSQARADWNRPGLLLYGASPFETLHPIEQKLQPVMALQSAIISIKDIPAGSPVGYGSTWVSQRPTRQGVVAIGYADGYPRHAANGTPVMVNGRRVPVIGRVSMDMLTIDLTDVPEARPGDSVVLWGKGLPAAEIARHARTIPYQLFCNLNRVPVEYVQSPVMVKA